MYALSLKKQNDFFMRKLNLHFKASKGAIFSRTPTTILINSMLVGFSEAFVLSEGLAK